MPDNDNVLSPRADSFQVWSCGHCENAHIILLNEKGARIAEILLSSLQANELRSFFYAMRHGEFPKNVAKRFLPKES